MNLLKYLYFSITFLGHYAAAKTHTITVGHYAFTFTPSTLSGVAVGDSVEFQFPGEQYSVVRAAYSSPCRRGVDTGSTSGGEDQAVWSGGVGGLTDENVCRSRRWIREKERVGADDGRRGRSS